MTQALMDYVTARHDAILSILEMLTAEHRLSDEHSSALAVDEGERGMDAAAASLADAVEALPFDRKPVGWNEPPAAAGSLMAARTRFVRAGLRLLCAECAEESADAASEAEYADEQLALAARNLAADVVAAKDGQ